MKKVIFTVAMVMLHSAAIFAQNNYSTNTAHISFYSKGSVTDVDAENQKVQVSLNTSSKQIIFTISMADFQFKSSKMGKDAQEKSLETVKFPNASFKGVVSSAVDFKKSGSYPVAVHGKLTIHGVEKEVNEKGTIIVAEDNIKLISKFHVQLKDYNIDTPTILGKTMVDDSMLVNVNATLLKETKKVVSKK